MHMKLSSAKWWPFCPGGDEFMYQGQTDASILRYVYNVNLLIVGSTAVHQQTSAVTLSIQFCQQTLWISSVPEELRITGPWPIAVKGQGLGTSVGVGLQIKTRAPRALVNIWQWLDSLVKALDETRHACMKSLSPIRWSEARKWW